MNAFCHMNKTRGIPLALDKDYVGLLLSWQNINDYCYENAGNSISTWHGIRLEVTVMVAICECFLSFL